MKGVSQIVRFGDEEFRVDVVGTGEVRIAGSDAVLRITPDGTGSYLVDDGVRRWHVTLWGTGERREVFADGERYELQVEAAGGRVKPGGASRRPQAESLTVPMPAKVVSVLVSEGQAVRRGDVVITLEAMKMQLPLRAPRDGTVRSVACREGDLVQPGVTLLEIV